MKVFCPACKEFHETDEVEFLDIEESIEGHDVMTFQCPVTDTVQKSKVFG